MALTVLLVIAGSGFIVFGLGLVATGDEAYPSINTIGFAIGIVLIGFAIIRLAAATRSRR